MKEVPQPGLPLLTICGEKVNSYQAHPRLESKQVASLHMYPLIAAPQKDERASVTHLPGPHTQASLPLQLC